MTEWTSSRSAGIIAGLLYGFNAHVLMRFPHLQAQHAEFFPIMLYAMDRVLVRNAARDRWLLAGAFTLQALCSNYFLVFSTFALVIAAAVRWPEWLPRERRPVLGSLTIAGVASVVAVAPFLWPYYQVRSEQGLVRSLDEVARYSAHWQDYLATGARIHYQWWSHAFVNGNAALFPGFIGLSLAVVAIATGQGWRDRRARMALAFGVLGVGFSFGPAFPGYAFLHTHLPLLTSMRGVAPPRDGAAGPAGHRGSAARAGGLDVFFWHPCHLRPPDSVVTRGAGRVSVLFRSARQWQRPVCLEQHALLPTADQRLQRL